MSLYCGFLKYIYTNKNNLVDLGLVMKNARVFMKLLNRSALICGLMLLIGCASPAQFENMIVKQAPDNIFDSALKEQVEVATVQGGSETNPLWVSQISNSNFQKAVEESLSIQGLLADDGRFNLKVTLLNVDQPMFGLDFEVVTSVNYIVVDNTTNKVLLDETIKAAHTATFGDAFDGVTRLRIANEGSGKNNIKMFLEQLSKLDVTGQLFLTN